MPALNLHFPHRITPEVWAEIKALLDTRVKGNWQEPTAKIVELLNKHNFTEPKLCANCPTADKHIQHLVIPFVETMTSLQNIITKEFVDELNDGKSFKEGISSVEAIESIVEEAKPNKKHGKKDKTGQK